MAINKTASTSSLQPQSQGKLDHQIPWQLSTWLLQLCHLVPQG